MTAINRITASSTTPSRNTVALRLLGLALAALSTANCSGPDSLPVGPSPVAIGPSPVTVAPAPPASSAPTPIASNACPPTLQQGTVTANIDGVPFAGDFSVQAGAGETPGVVGRTILIVNAVSCVFENGTYFHKSVGFVVGNPLVALTSGTYPVATSPGLPGARGLTGTSAVSSPTVPGVNRQWTTDQGISSGSITITSISATGASGTFSFVAPPDTSSGASGNKTVTNGAFTVRF